MSRRAVFNLHRVPPDARVVLRLYTHCPICQRYWDAVAWEGSAAHLQTGQFVDASVPTFECCCQSFRPHYFKILWMDRLIAVGPLSMLIRGPAR